VISDYDHIKEEKIIDNVSLASHNYLGDLLANNDKSKDNISLMTDPEHPPFEILCKEHKEAAPLDSVSEFSVGSKY